MGAGKDEWPQTYPLHLINEWPTDRLKHQPGVYRIRAFYEQAQPRAVRRFNGDDPEGILHIGMSSNLFNRLRSFYRGAVEQKFPAHFASSEFIKWKFDKSVPADQLRFDFIGTPNAQAAKDLETELHRAYRYKFLDRPPLDGTSGKRFKIGVR